MLKHAVHNAELNTKRWVQQSFVENYVDKSISRWGSYLYIAEIPAYQCLGDITMLTPSGDSFLPSLLVTIRQWKT